MSSKTQGVNYAFSHNSNRLNRGGFFSVVDKQLRAYGGLD